MRKNLLLAVILSTCCFPAFAQTSPQIRTATFLNNLNQFQEVFGNQNYPRSATAEDVAVVDDIYACSRKLQAVTDSSAPFSLARSVSSLALQGFGFEIPDGATIVNISVRLSRFKNGRPSIGDHTLSLMQRYQCSPGIPCRYGKHWTYHDDYPGKIYPDAETEYTFSQSGSGNDGGANHNETYQWTPAMVNAVTFGVRIDNYVPIGRGSVAVCYDLVEVTVEFSLPATISNRSTPSSEVKTLKEPIIYPNPFTTKTNIQFTPIENGNAVVELYNISGIKLRTLFSGHVTEGRVYNVTAGDTRLANGIYIYVIRNGKQKHIGRIIKLE